MKGWGNDSDILQRLKKNRTWKKRVDGKREGAAMQRNLGQHKMSRSLKEAERHSD